MNKIIEYNETIFENIKHIDEYRNEFWTGKVKEEIIKDYKLSRYICYLIVQNADPKKEAVALGQTYFAIQTRKQEITEQEYDSLSDDEKRFYQKITDIYSYFTWLYILHNFNENSPKKCCQLYIT